MKTRIRKKADFQDACLRAEKHLGSRIELAERLKVPYRTLEGWCQGRFAPRVYYQDFFIVKCQEIINAR